MWTDEMTAICFGMKRAGITNKAIAARLGVTPEQVARKCRRMAHKTLFTRAGRGDTKRSRLAADRPSSRIMEDL